MREVRLETRGTVHEHYLPSSRLRRPVPARSLRLASPAAPVQLALPPMRRVPDHGRRCMTASAVVGYQPARLDLYDRSCREAYDAVLTVGQVQSWWVTRYPGEALCAAAPLADPPPSCSPWCRARPAGRWPTAARRGLVLTTPAAGQSCTTRRKPRSAPPGGQPDPANPLAPPGGMRCPPRRRSTSSGGNSMSGILIALGAGPLLDPDCAADEHADPRLCDTPAWHDLWASLIRCHAGRTVRCLPALGSGDHHIARLPAGNTPRPLGYINNRMQIDRRARAAALKSPTASRPQSTRPGGPALSPTSSTPTSARGPSQTTSMRWPP